MIISKFSSARCPEQQAWKCTVPTSCHNELGSLKISWDFYEDHVLHELPTINSDIEILV